MISSAFRREKYLLTIGIVRLLDYRMDAALPRPAVVLQLILTNLRNRPLSSTSMDTMRESILSLYHNLITGSKDFPLIPYKGNFRSCQTATPFVDVEQGQRENTRPSPLMEGPSGVMVPTAGSAAPPTILTPVLPERTELGALMADRRNCVQRMEVDGRTVWRVISPVYNSDSAELRNRWRVTDYSADGHVLMSSLCRFTKDSTLCAKGKRKDSEGPSRSSVSPPEKRLRV